MDLRQSEEWGKFLSQISWTTAKIGDSQAFIRKIPLLPLSIIKLQRPSNPLSVSDLDQLAKKHHAVCTILEPEAENFREDFILGQGFEKAPRMSLLHTSTISIDLQKSQEELFTSFSENARRNIKKSQKYNLKIETVFLKEDNAFKAFNKFYRLLLNLEKMKECYIPSKGEIYKKMDAFKNSSVLLFAYTKDKEKPVASVWLGYFKDTAVYLHTGNTEEGYELLANYLLVWESLKIAQKLKLKVFDFEGIYDPRFHKLRKSWYNFTQFKKRFHGKIIEYPVSYIKCYNIVFKAFYLCSKAISR